MEVEINGRSIQIDKEGITLAELLSNQGFSGIGQAVAVNNKVVPRADWGSFRIESGMKLTVIRAVCGG